MDKSWLNIRNRVDQRYRGGVESFLNWAFSQPGVSTIIRCPCKGCMNTVFKLRINVRGDLLNKGFWDSYKVWDLHGEVLVRVDDEVEDDSIEEDNITEMIHDACGYMNVEDNTNSSEGNEEPNMHATKFYKLLENAQTELYPGCTKVSKLSFVVKLLHLKCLNHWSNKSMDELLSFFKEVLPEGSFVPKSFYEAKKVLCDLGLGYTKIDACQNDCILYWHDYVNAQSCPKCGKSRWKSEGHKGKKVAHKVLRHFPIKPRLQRLYMEKETAKKMRWHKEENIDDGVLRHPSDSIEWKSFNERHPTFSTELRNVRLGLASDGFQPYGNMSSNHSIWPVVLVTYNFPPWDCMKNPYFMMTLLIPGPKCPGNDIDVYLQPMIEELKELWDGVETYDAHSKSNFLMRVALLWTINDFPAYGNLSGWSTKGKLACPCFHKDTQSVSLHNKLCYMGHRRFLPINHPWRRNRVLFDGKVEMGAAPSPLTGDGALMQLQDLGNVTYGKVQKRKRNVSNNAYNWRKKSIFFQLPYWKNLMLRHNLDVMHIERNVSDNILSTVMNMVGKTKDTLKSRYDLVDLGIRQGLHPIEDGDNILLPAACYALSIQEKLKVCDFLANLKVPDAFSSNISRCVNILEKKIHGLKCHNHHVLLQGIFPVAIHGLLPKEVCEPIIALAKFFKNLYSKCLTIEDLDILEAEIPIILCKLQMVFLPVFFDVMIHLTIHLAIEAKLGGPVQYRDMYPIERYLRTLKSYVRNLGRPEGSIAEGYLAEESLTFCSRYLKNISTKFNKPTRNDDGSRSKGEMSFFKNSGQPKGAATYSKKLPHDEFNQACMEYTREIESQGSMRAHRMHNNKFLDWFRACIFVLSAQGCANDDLISLAVSPDPLVHRYSTFMVNGFRFQTKELVRKTQNSGVLVRGDDSDPNKEYYGVLEDIYELSYVGNRKVYLFKCHWCDVARLGRGYKIDKYGFTSVNTHCALNTNEPFVLASQSEQVFYLNDMVNKDLLVVVKTNPRDLFNIPEVEDEALLNEEVYQQEDVECNILRTNDQETEIEVSLHRDDIEPQTVLRTNDQGNEEDDFINDNDIDVSENEEDEEELLDDNDGEDSDTSS
ncbi:uncharacterized protein LOC132601805 [Lycium barbarum]|uniref:uncharacterized protein LOC132601805 n=1 Tax=Lycium barbarum TaxID=112863 RepID=UPI00293ECF8C|nr:uncharacterized protein LOC132601805 [Lycium barbarum]